MLKDDSHPNPDSELVEDLQFMLSSIRARQNGLIFFLQRFKNIISLNSAEFKSTKNQFQQKQKIYSLQITKILQKHAQLSYGNLYAVRAFWVKLKTIIKVSIQRIQSLNIPQMQKIRICYDKALAAITRSSDSQKSLIAYKQVQNFLKKRNIEALLLGRQAVSPSSISYSESKIQKNRSQTLFKPDSAVSRFTIQNQDSQLFSKAQTFALLSKDRINKFQHLNGLTGIEQESNSISQPKIKSLNRIKNRRPDQIVKANILNFIKVQQRGKLKSNSKASQKYIKKINKQVQKYEKNFEGAFDGKYEVSLDKKKTFFQNIYLLYDDLFAKNIPNHKMISKFMFNTTKINQIIYNAYEKKKKLHKKQKQKPSNADVKDKQSNAHRKQKKQKQLTQQKQKHIISKPGKPSRKIQSAKDSHHVEIIQVNTTTKQRQKQKQHVHQKKQSQTTAFTYKYQRQAILTTNQKVEKVQKEKAQKQRMQRQKKIQRSKTAKIKLNSEIQNPHLQVLSHNIFGAKHFVSQKEGKGEKFVRIGV